MARINGTSARDKLRGTGLADLIQGLAGDDDLAGRSGDDTLNGGAGNDTLGGGGNDSLAGGSGDDMLKGERGTDTLKGGSGNDTLTGGSGADSLSGGTGNDTLAPGADLLADVVNGGAGVDTVDYSAATGGVVVFLFNNFANLAAANDSFTSIENLIGSVFGDTLGAAAADGSHVFGGLGDDFVFGSGPGFTAIVQGGMGNDTLSGVSDSQDLLQLERGKGVDSIVFVFRDHSDRLLIDNAEFNIGLTVTSSEIVSGAGAQIANQVFAQFLFNETTTELSFDPDGTGAAAAELIATVGFRQGGSVLLASDFYVI